jgi:hypothetical protein
VIRHRVYSRVSGRGCADCKGEIARLAQKQKSNDENDGPSRYECPSCHSVWERLITCRMLDISLTGIEARRMRRLDRKFFEAQSDAKCTRCGKPICLNGAFGEFGEREPEGLLVSGAAYCWDCAERTAAIVEEAAVSFGGSIR